jgi:hypothetical protein
MLSPIHSSLAPAPLRPSSLKEGKDKEKAIDPPSPEEVDAWRLESNASTASSLHPGFRRALTPRYLPLHKIPKTIHLPNIDDVLSEPSSPSVVLSQSPPPPGALRYGDFFATPVESRSPVNRTGQGNASPVDTERFFKLPEYTGDSPPYERVRPERRVDSASHFRDESKEWGIEGWQRAEQEMGWEREQERARGATREQDTGKGLVGRIKGLFRKMRGVSGDEGCMVEEKKKNVFGGLKSRVSRTGVSVGKLFGRVREG